RCLALCSVHPRLDAFFLRPTAFALSGHSVAQLEHLGLGAKFSSSHHDSAHPHAGLMDGNRVSSGYRGLFAVVRVSHVHDLHVSTAGSVGKVRRLVAAARFCEPPLNTISTWPSLFSSRRGRASERRRWCPPASSSIRCPRQ